MGVRVLKTGRVSFGRSLKAKVPKKIEFRKELSKSPIGKVLQCLLFMRC